MPARPGKEPVEVVNPSDPTSHKPKGLVIVIDDDNNNNKVTVDNTVKISGEVSVNNWPALLPRSLANELANAKGITAGGNTFTVKGISGDWALLQRASEKAGWWHLPTMSAIQGGLIVERREEEHR